ncbi:hypothetical protein U0070_012026, partial [Myodes glareolus]
TPTVRNSLEWMVNTSLAHEKLMTAEVAADALGEEGKGCVSKTSRPAAECACCWCMLAIDQGELERRSAVPRSSILSLHVSCNPNANVFFGRKGTLGKGRGKHSLNRSSALIFEEPRFPQEERRKKTITSQEGLVSGPTKRLEK